MAKKQCYDKKLNLTDVTECIECEMNIMNQPSVQQIVNLK